MFGVLVLLMVHVDSQNGNGVTTSCVQQQNCGLGCVNTTANGTCYRCGPSWYKNTTGSTPCLTCPVNSGSLCTICGGETSCGCNVGYTGLRGAVCTVCVAGTYKSTPSTAACTVKLSLSRFIINNILLPGGLTFLG